MAGKFVLEPQLFLLEAVENGFVGVGAVLFNVDFNMERCMLGCEGLDVSIVHRSISFRWLSRDSAMNKPRKKRRVFIDHQQFDGRLARLVAGNRA
jgi:hypothetical protein